MVKIIGSLVIAFYAIGSSLALLHNRVILALAGICVGLITAYITIEVNMIVDRRGAYHGRIH